MKYHKAITLICILLLALPAMAKVTFNFTFDEQGIADKNIDAQLIEYVKGHCCEAGKILGSYLNHNQSVDILVLFYSEDDKMLASAHSPLTASDTIRKEGFYGTIVADKIQYGIDHNAEEPDAFMRINLFRDFDQEGCHLQEAIEDPEGYEHCKNIKRIIIHELIHTLGFIGELDFTSNALEEARSRFKSESEFQEFYNTFTLSKNFNLLKHFNYQGKGIFSNYDYHIQDKNGTPLWERKLLNSSVFTEPGYFAGPNTKAAFFGLALPLPQKDKLDYYHSCDADFLSLLCICNIICNNDKFVIENEPLRLSAIEIAMLQDIGFDINIELAGRTRELHQLLDYCPNLQNIEDKNDKLSIFSAFINLLPEEEQAGLRHYLTEEEEPNDLSALLSNHNDADSKERE